MKLAIPVYLANSYSAPKGMEKDAGNLLKAKRRLREAYVGGILKKKFKGKYCFLLPISLSASMADLCSFGTGFKIWAKDDYTWITICSEVWVLMSEGWRESVGVQAEIEYAKKIGKPVKYIEDETYEVQNYAPEDY